MGPKIEDTKAHQMGNLDAHVAEDETLRKLVEEFNDLEDEEEWED